VLFKAIPMKLVNTGISVQVVQRTLNDLNGCVKRWIYNLNLKEANESWLTESLDIRQYYNRFLTESRSLTQTADRFCMLRPGNITFPGLSIQ